ncbi:Zn-ribbon domain-containing OB-fold protein [Actinomycetospora atypica]|uniref:Zn-ribbon domain-containing OB-fold protein n=1 Tax=Actinomycetospora atypica TaxID=1290095 RepID=A0ABV9YI14_9PSEU
MSVPPALDPRPTTQVADDGRHVVAGGRCRRCHEAHAFRWPRCATCGGELEPATFGPGGTVWSSTVVRIAVPGRTAPYVLAYVDLDDGPRVLAHVAPTADDAVEAVPIGSPVLLTSPSPAGDPTVEPQR